jgi:hypothetical protein
MSKCGRGRYRAPEGTAVRALQPPVLLCHGLRCPREESPQLPQDLIQGAALWRLRRPPHDSLPWNPMAGVCTWTARLLGFYMAPGISPTWVVNARIEAAKLRLHVSLESKPTFSSERGSCCVAQAVLSLRSSCNDSCTSWTRLPLCMSPAMPAPHVWSVQSSQQLWEEKSYTDCR